MPVDILFPFQFDARGRTALAVRDAHIEQMIEQLLFTNPGERVNRPDFGSGLQQLIFAPNSPELAAAVEFNMRAAVQRYLGDLIEVQSLAVTCDDATITIDLRYILRSTGQLQTPRFTRPAG
jgi:phage baseplate assembly protein W